LDWHDLQEESLDSFAVPRSQRLAFLGIAAVIAVVAVILLASSGGDDDDSSSDRTSATATPTETQAADTDSTATAEPTATPTPKPKPKPPLVTSDKVTELRFKEGETVRFRVRSDVADEVHVHGYDLMKDVEPGETITFSFPADMTGIYVVELENAGKQIASLRIDPS
jgi:heme/copper-type cytochrome/quinol oxidase subunit 2